MGQQQFNRVVLPLTELALGASGPDAQWYQVARVLGQGAWQGLSIDPDSGLRVCAVLLDDDVNPTVLHVGDILRRPFNSLRVGAPQTEPITRTGVGVTLDVLQPGVALQPQALILCTWGAVPPFGYPSTTGHSVTVRQSDLTGAGGAFTGQPVLFVHLGSMEAASVWGSNRNSSNSVSVDVDVHPLFPGRNPAETFWRGPKIGTITLAAAPDGFQAKRLAILPDLANGLAGVTELGLYATSGAPTPAVAATGTVNFTGVVGMIDGDYIAVTDNGTPAHTLFMYANPTATFVPPADTATVHWQVLNLGAGTGEQIIAAAIAAAGAFIGMSASGGATVIAHLTDLVAGAGGNVAITIGNAGSVSPGPFSDPALSVTGMAGGANLGSSAATFTVGVQALLED